jgi:beta-glucosidase
MGKIGFQSIFRKLNMVKFRIQYLVICIAIASIWILSCSSTKQTSGTASSSDEDMDKLIAKMSVEEKVGQMIQINLDVICEGGIFNLVEPHHIEKTKLKTAIHQWHVGSVLNCGGHAYPIAQWHEIISLIQEETTISHTKIPVLYGIDAIHGANYVMGSTLFPQQLAQAATFSPNLTSDAAAITAYETRAAGIPWNFSPVLDVARNPNWSRYFETFGEDPLVCSRFGKAMIEGYQGNTNSPDAMHVAACMKHFLGYSGARTGKDRTPSYLSDIELCEIYLPSFKAAIAAGAMSVMINSGEINGIPVHANPIILTELLRNELKFQGVAVTDWEDVMKLHQIHRVSAGMKESVKMAVDAGIDMCMVPNDFEFAKYLIELVKEGKISMARINQSVKRILVMKKRLGLFDQKFTPAKTAYPLFGSESHRRAALQTALESITLLKNEGNVLPLKKEQKIFLTGPASNSMTILNGAWTRTWQGVDEKYNDASQMTINDVMKKMAGDQLSWTEGCGLESIDNTDAAILAASKCDVVVVCLGEKPCTEKPGDIESLHLPDAQREYVKRLHKTGKPIVIVLVENRPRIIEDIEKLCQAVVMAYLPGDQGGKAIAQILYGEVNPSGKLPFTYPRNEQSILLYDHKYSEELDVNFQFNAFQPQWPFGFGMGYAEIEYSPITLSTDVLRGEGKLVARIFITNKGNRSAKEAVLLFSRDHVASITPSVKKLRDFVKIELAAGETREVSFEIDRNMLSFINARFESITEAGQFDIMIGNQIKTFTYQL